MPGLDWKSQESRSRRLGSELTRLNDTSQEKNPACVAATQWRRQTANAHNRSSRLIRGAYKQLGQRPLFVKNH